jgi:hypothetical protein
LLEENNIKTKFSNIKMSSKSIKIRAYSGKLKVQKVTKKTYEMGITEKMAQKKIQKKKRKCDARSCR